MPSQPQCSKNTQIEQAISKNPSILTNIYEEEVNIAVWQRDLSITLKQAVTAFIEHNPLFQASMSLSAHSALSDLTEYLGDDHVGKVLSIDIAQIVDMFCYLFELKRVGLRLTVLSHAMCPRFHVDRVPCRLITTYQGAATQWLSNPVLDRSKLGHGSGGLPDNKSGLYTAKESIQQMSSGDIALLKGELWEGNEGSGIVHRSPNIKRPRLLLTLDFSQ
jgi:hypothetical protein